MFARLQRQDGYCGAAVLQQNRLAIQQGLHREAAALANDVERQLNIAVDRLAGRQPRHLDFQWQSRDFKCERFGLDLAAGVAHADSQRGRAWLEFRSYQRDLVVLVRQGSIVERVVDLRNRQLAALHRDAHLGALLQQLAFL